MRTLSQEDVYNLFCQKLQDGEVSKYHKHIKMYARLSEPGETVLTVLNGILETVKKANFGDLVMLNPQVGGAAEKYLLDGKNFWGRYDIHHDAPISKIDGYEYYEVQAKGVSEGFLYSGESFVFIAPWGSEMLCNDGDAIIRPLSLEREIYRVERKTFDQTYKHV